MAKRPVRIGVIGLGWPGNEHLKGYRDTPEADVVALCDLKRNLLAAKAEEYGVADTYTSYKKMLARDDIDAIDVCIPNDLHASATIDSLAAGKHVLCEKPPARKAEEAKRMAAAAKRTKKTLMYAVCLRFNAPAQYLKECIDAGELGEIYFARTVYLRRRGIPLGSKAWFVNKRRAGGGCLIDIGVHALDLAWWLLGNPKPKVVLGSAYDKFAHTVPADVKYDVEDAAFAMVKFVNGATLLLEASWALNQAGGSVQQIAGTKGGAEMHPLRIFTERDGVQVDMQPSVPGNNMFAAEVRHFAQCVQSRRKPLSDAKQGVHLMQMLDAIYESQKTGKEVRIR